VVKAKVEAFKEKDKSFNTRDFPVTPTTELNATLDDILLAILQVDQKALMATR
jgi:hypothetical protein